MTEQSHEQILPSPSGRGEREKIPLYSSAQALTPTPLPEGEGLQYIKYEREKRQLCDCPVIVDRDPLNSSIIAQLGIAEKSSIVFAWLSGWATGLLAFFLSQNIAPAGFGLSISISIIHGYWHSQIEVKE